MSAVDIVPGTSIGMIRIGTRAADLPKGATVADSAGQLDGIRFSLVAGAVNDVWIDDIRTFPHEIRLGGNPVNRKASLDELKKVFGPCDRVEGVKGGTFFNCRNGMAIGTDPEETGAFVQLRLKPR
jgi:hypothetical protein